MSKLPSNLPQILRARGLKVVEHHGWQTRGRPGAFNPVGVLCHHTATSKRSKDSDVIALLIRGRSDLPGPLCQIGLDRDGTVHLIAADRANHAGKAKASGTVGAGDGNALYVGVEAFNDGVGEKWPAAQYNAYVTLAAALSANVTGNSAQSVRGHKETSVTGKIDPTFDMDDFRAAVAKQIRPKETPVSHRPPPRPRNPVTTTPALRFKAALLAACKTAASDVPAKRVAVHAIRRTVQTLAGRIK